MFTILYLDETKLNNENNEGEIQLIYKLLK